MTIAKNLKPYLIIICGIFFLKLISLGVYPFHHPSEARYGSMAMRIALTNNFLMPYFTPDIPFLGKPPLAFWASAVSFKIFGLSEFAGRMPHYLALLAVCFLVYNLMAKKYDKKTALTSVIILSSCGMFYALHSIMTEAFLLLGMTIISTSFWIQLNDEKPKNIYGYLFFIGCVIAFLTKGPVGLAMPGLPIFIYLLISKRWKELWQKFPVISGTIIFLILALPWFILAQAKYPDFLNYFLIGENFDRFAESGWTGDRYGNAHKVHFGEIWLFFALCAFPATALLFAKPKQIFSRVKQEIKSDQMILFWAISFALPIVILTFMRNMIATYIIYFLIPFVIILSRVIILQNWGKFTIFAGYLTIIGYSLAIIVFLIMPQKLEERLNYQSFLLDHIPSQDRTNKNLQLYYSGDPESIFELYWVSKDKVKNIGCEQINSIKYNDEVPQYFISMESVYEKYQDKLDKIVCTDKNHFCLYGIKK